MALCTYIVFVLFFLFFLFLTGPRAEGLVPLECGPPYGWSNQCCLPGACRRVLRGGQQTLSRWESS